MLVRPPGPLYYIQLNSCPCEKARLREARKIGARIFFGVRLRSIQTVDTRNISNPYPAPLFTSVYEGRDVVVWFPTGYEKSVCYQLLPYMLDVKFRRASTPPYTWTSYIYSAFFIRILIYAFTVCYTVRYPDYLAHAYKYTCSRYQASLLSLEAWD